MTGRASLRTRLIEVLGEIAPGLTVERLLAYWFSQDARLNADLLNELAALGRRGLLVCLATNQEHWRMHYLMHSVGFAAKFDGCYYSAEIGHRKPAREFFEAVVMKVRLSPGELLLIDDAAENVRAALAAGWHAVHWTGRERIVSDGG